MLAATADQNLKIENFRFHGDHYNDVVERAISRSWSYKLSFGMLCTCLLVVTMSGLYVVKSASGVNVLKDHSLFAHAMQADHAVSYLHRARY